LTAIRPSPHPNITMDVHLACINEPFRKVLFFINGIEKPTLGGDFDFNTRNMFAGDKFGYFNPGNPRLRDFLELEGYDLVFIDWVDALRDMRENAEGVIAAIDFINDLKEQNGSEEKNIVLGMSMGGVIGKYALLSMENQGIDHETEKFLAFDSPLRGANVPLGLQYLYEFIRGIEIKAYGVPILDFTPQLSEVDRTFNSPAVQQLLLYHTNAFDEGELPRPHQDFIDFQSDLTALGDFSNCEYICVSNGSVIGQGQELVRREKSFTFDFTETDPVNLAWDLEDLDPEIDGPVNFLNDIQTALRSFIIQHLTNSRVRLKLEVWALPQKDAASPDKIFKGKINLRLLTAVPIPPIPPLPPVVVPIVIHVNESGTLGSNLDSKKTNIEYLKTFPT